VLRSRRLHCVLTAVRCAIDALGQCDQRGFRYSPLVFHGCHQNCCCCETHNARALRTPKHEGRNRNGLRRGDTSCCYHRTCWCCSTQRAHTLRTTELAKLDQNDAISRSNLLRNMRGGVMRLCPFPSSESPTMAPDFVPPKTSTASSASKLPQWCASSPLE